MDIFDGLTRGMQIVINPLNLSLILIGALIGLLIGILPRIRAIHGVAILLPISYAIGLQVETTLIFLVNIYCGSICGSRISDVLNDTESKKSGEIGSLLVITSVSSFSGGVIAVFGMTISVFLLQSLAVQFGPAEYFALVVFALASLSIRAGKHPVRTLVSTCIGLMMATVGIDSTTGVLRFTFHEPELYDGIEFTTVVIGLFAIKQAFVLLEKGSLGAATIPQVKNVYLNIKEFYSYKWILFRSSFVGFLVGLLPCAGTSLASSVSNSIEKRITSADSGILDGMLRKIVAEETANNSAAGGALIAMLAFGIPGSGTTAILLGALLLYNITPGPILFVQHTDIVWSIICSMCFGSLLLLIMNLLFIKYLIKIHQTPNWLFVPLLIVLAFIGGFSVNASSLSLLLLIILGGFAYLLEKLEYPLIPLLLGFVLGELMEDNLRRALAISGGDLDILFSSLISNSLWGMSLFVILLSFSWQRWKGKWIS